MSISDEERIRAREYERKRNSRLVQLRNEYQDIEATLAAVKNQLGGTHDFRSLKRIGNRDVSSWKTADKAIRVEALRFRSQALKRQLLDIAAEKDADAKARGFYVGPMIHPDPTPYF